MFNKVSVLVDNNSWILVYAEQLVDELIARGITAALYRNQADIPKGDVCFLLGCTQLVIEDVLARNKYNLVVHESALPQGKGFAPMAWQIIAGQHIIPVSLIEASTEVDSGDIWLQENIVLTGNELCREWRAMQGEISVRLALRFVDQYEQLSPTPQQGKESFYPRRTPLDSELDPRLSLNELMPLLRTVDNQNYPAFFYYNGQKFRLEIHKDD
ncbi:formyltransferase family protein [Thalassotalea euphylliae]|uniref:Methionyl-tRNA formyltransferase n=1 Tax=Thalassotalea euphylliae TaxID=1655234 RepID=A0A3E0UCU5_9GAMM|nr:formyltransferase family protein [Thalassotalea euphylliae]REL34818.1 methionyl-tRNA formyltransferase [Thalassotalea euphylliae]